MPCGLCHIIARNSASGRAEVPASDASWVVKWVRKNNFLVPCIYLEVRKLCWLHYNMMLDIPGLEPYTTPLPPSNLIIPLASLTWLVMWGWERSQNSTSKNRKEAKSGCMVDATLVVLHQSYFVIQQENSLFPQTQGVGMWATSLKDTNRST